MRTDTPTFPPGGSEPTLLPVHPRPRPSAHGLTPVPHPPYLFTGITDSWCYWDWNKHSAIPWLPSQLSQAGLLQVVNPQPLPPPAEGQAAPQAPDLLWAQPRSLTPAVRSSGCACVPGGMAHCLPAALSEATSTGAWGCCRLPRGHCPLRCPPRWLVSMEKDTGSSDGEPGPPSSLP